MTITKPLFKPRRVLPAAVFLLAALCLGACSFSPAPVIMYRAESPGAFWDRGTEYHATRTASLEIRTAFLELSSDYLSGYQGSRPLFFMVSAENRSDGAILLDPLDFRISIPCMDSALEPIDPEAVILRTRQDEAAENARHAGSLGTSAALGLGDLVLDLAMAFTQTTKEQQRDQEESKEQTRQYKEDEEIRHRERAAEIAARRTLWSDSAFRKTTLLPGGTLRGRVAFAVAAYSMPPDSLLVQFREGKDKHINLIAYGLIREKPLPTALGKQPPSDSMSTAGPNGNFRLLNPAAPRSTLRHY
jgi:hypothetical protein